MGLARHRLAVLSCTAEPIIRYRNLVRSIDLKRSLEKVMYPIGLMGPLMMIPQIVKIFAEKNASSILLSSWLFFLFVSISWFFYGVLNKNKVLIISHFSWILAYSFVIVGAIVY